MGFMGRPADFNVDDSYATKENVLIQQEGGLPSRPDFVNHFGYDMMWKVEIKTVRKEYAAFTLEEWSNEGLRKGWMFTSDADLLIYNMTLSCGYKSYWLDMKRLQEWFIENERYKKYSISKTPNKSGNLTICRVIPIGDIPDKFYFVKGRCTP